MFINLTNGGYGQATPHPVGPGEVTADEQSGSDIGAKINSSKAALAKDTYGVANGFIKLAGGTNAVYYFSTTIQLNTLNAVIDCRGATLVWTGPNAAAAVVLAGPLRKNANGNAALISVGSANGGLENCNIQTLQTYRDSTNSRSPANPQFVPSIARAQVSSGGEGYAAGDIVQILQVGATLGTALVTGVNGGAATEIAVLHGGYDYKSAQGLATSGGSGKGLTVSISANAPVSCYPYNPSPSLPTAIFTGGDPTGRIPNDPSSNYGNYQYLHHVHISGFCGAYVPGDNSWQNQFEEVVFDHNYWDVDDESSPLITNSGERSAFVGSRLDGATGAAIRNDGGSQYTIGSGTSLDYNEVWNEAGQWTGGVPVLGSFMQLDFVSAHIEDRCGPLIAQHGTYRGYVNLTDGDVRVGNATACSTAFFAVAGTNGSFSASHVVFDAKHKVPFYVSNPTNGAVLDISDPVRGIEGDLPAQFSTETASQAVLNYGARKYVGAANPSFIWSNSGPSSATVGAFVMPNLRPSKGPGGAGQAMDIYVGQDGGSFNNARLRFYDVGGMGAADNFGALMVGGEAAPDLKFGNGVVTVPGNLQASSDAGTGAARFAIGEASGGNARIDCANGHVCDSVSGTVALTTGGAPSTGTLARIVFGVARHKLANCVVESLGSDGIVTSITWTESATDLTLTATAPLPRSSSYAIKYWCGGS